jgi:hypothetical protein
MERQPESEMSCRNLRRSNMNKKVCVTTISFLAALMVPLPSVADREEERYDRHDDDREEERYDDRDDDRREERYDEREDERDDRRVDDREEDRDASTMTTTTA